jgi:glycosyltransferase involved in cell wall biosynthesis
LFKDENIIVQHHGGSWPLKHLKQKNRYKKFFPLFLLAQFWETLVLKNINCFFLLSEDEMNYLKKVAPNSKVRFQTMGVEEIYFEKIDKKIARKKLDLSQKKKIILFLGRTTEAKGLRYLIDAMKKLKGTVTELKIGGFGKEQKKFEDYVKSEKIDNVEFLGGIFGEKKMLYLSSADVLVLPSLKEGAPVVIMEALAKNVPVVATDVGGVSLMIKNGREGIIIKTKSPEEIVRGIKEILSWKKKDVKKYADKYKWKKIIDDTIKDYKNLN